MAPVARATAGFSEREHLQTLQLRADRSRQRRSGSGVNAAPDSSIRRAVVEVENADLGFINDNNLGDSLVAIRGEANDVI